VRQPPLACARRESSRETAGRYILQLASVVTFSWNDELALWVPAIMWTRAASLSWSREARPTRISGASRSRRLRRSNRRNRA